GLLRDRNEKVGRLAGTTLLDLVRKFNRENPNAQIDSNQDLEEESPTEKSGQLISDYDILKKAVKKAVHNFDIHRRQEVVLAGMCLAQADEIGFWQEKLAGYHPVGRMVRELLLNYGWGDLAGFCLSALRVGDLRTTAIRAISEQERGGFVGALAEQIKHERDDVVSRSLKTITQAKWLDTKIWLRSGFTEQEQLGLVDLVGLLGISQLEKARALVQMAKIGADAASLKAVVRLSETEGDSASKGYLELLQWDREQVALAAAWQLIKKEVKGVERIMVEQMKSRHEQVRRLAWGYYRGVAFKRYWGNFDRLSLTQKIAGGRAVFKLDQQAEQKWRQKVRFGTAKERLRAIRVARLLERPAQWQQELVELVQDQNRKVRSCAVAGLGETQHPDKQAGNMLLQALKDTDPRVRANAVEALEKQGWQDTRWMIKLTRDNDNRVRANAIKALLSVRTESARMAVREMLNDQRSKHRRSARWVLETINEGWKMNAESNKQETYSTKAGGILV
ncbi:MAG: HEAT repeat domain-containing protein, partial [Planctomycetes bacterium]|nr:HEAT repeat domain-containing protein [Planctomycetota bacterium]